MRHAYFTLVARDKYVDGTVCLYKSLRTTTTYPLIALTFDVSASNIARLSNMGIECRPVEKIEANKAVAGKNCARVEDFSYTYTKLHIFNYDEFDRIIFLDSDLVVIKNIDHLFETNFQNIAACDCTPFSKTIFNSGVLIIKPDRKIFQDMMNKKDTLRTYDGGDQGFLNSYFAEWTKLDIKYNSGKRIFSRTPDQWKTIDKHVIHFVGQKPWLGGEPGYAELEKIWFDYYNLP
jgi:alpha-N-acetylglucosamine transferase